MTNSTLTVGSLFSGIGGLELGLERAGMRVIWQCEIEPYARAVLKKHWPNVPKYEDVRALDERVERPDVICGGFPCQDISLAGHGKGLAGERSGLWGAYLSAIRVLQPSFVVIENSPGLIVRGLDSVLGGLAESGFDAEWQVIRASDFTLPHRRERLFIVAYANGEHGTARVGTKQNWQGTVFPRSNQQCVPVRVQAADRFVGVDDGVSGALYRHRGRCLGNAVVPSASEWIGRHIIRFVGAST